MTDFDTSKLVEATLPQERKNRRRRSRRGRNQRRLMRQLRRMNWVLIFAGGIGILLAVFVGALVLTVDARGQVDQSWHGVERMLDEINSKPGTELTLADYDLLQLSVSDLNQSLGKAKSRTRFLRPLDFASSDVQTSLQVLDSALELAQAAEDVLNGLEPAVFYMAEGEETEAVTPGLSSGHRLVELLNLGRANFIKANAHLQAAQRQIDAMPLAGVSPDLFITVDQLRSFHEMLTDYNTLLLESPELFTTMLGLEQARTYLVLSQNNDELRPSGGYISTYGWLKVRKGRVSDYFYGPTSPTTPNPPGDDVEFTLEIPDWWIGYEKPVYAAWDSSWYADFPTTAQLAAWYFDNGGNLNEPVDGVIAIDTIGFELILEGLESVTVAEYGETVTAENFRDVIYRIRAEGAAEREHKKFLAALYYQILTDWQHAEQDESATLRRAVLQALQEKHIMLYFADDTLSAAMDVLGWSGAQDMAARQDYLMVADANVNGSKHNRSVIREVTYDVAVQENGTLESRAAIAYDYSARVAEQDPAIQPEHYLDIDYFGNHQVFVPAGAQLRDTRDLQHDVDIVETASYTSFVSFFQLEYDSGERFQYTYSTPNVIEEIGPYRRYKLLLQKQPGMLGEMVNVQVMLPPTATVVEVSPEPVARYDLQQPILEFRIELAEDTWIEVVYTQ